MGVKDINGTSAQNKTPANATPDTQMLAAAKVKDLAGPNTVYYDCRESKWNTIVYNGYVIYDQYMDTRNVRAFKAAMDAVPEFFAHYEFVAPVTMTTDRVSPSLRGRKIVNPKYSRTGTLVVGNIIVRNKETGEYELYCKSWVPVHDYRKPDGATLNIGYGFSGRGAIDANFRAMLLAAHTY